MILVDTSAWIEFLRATGSPTHRALQGFLKEGQLLATTEVVIMEVMAGARDDDHMDRLTRLLLGHELLVLHGLSDFEGAARLYRHCRQRGDTIRSLTDCLIATVAIREGVAVLHVDRDYGVIARHSELKVHPVPASS